MDPNENWDNETRFKLQLHEYLVKKKMTTTAAIFKLEAQVPDRPVALDDSEFGFLQDWWSIFWVAYNKNNSEAEAEPQVSGSSQAMQMGETSNNQPHLPTEPRTSQQSQRSNDSLNFDPLGRHIRRLSVRPVDLTSSVSSFPQVVEHLTNQGIDISSATPALPRVSFQIACQLAGIATVMHMAREQGILPVNVQFHFALSDLLQVTVFPVTQPAPPRNSAVNNPSSSRRGEGAD